MDADNDNVGSGSDQIGIRSVQDTVMWDPDKVGSVCGLIQKRL